MGHVKRDLHANERRLDETYALDNPLGLRILLSDYHALLNRQYQGDYDAVVLLADLSTALQMAQLTGRQSEALRLVYELDLTQEEAGKQMGIAQKNVSEALDRALENVAEVYWYWSRHGEGYCLAASKNERGRLT